MVNFNIYKLYPKLYRRKDLFWHMTYGFIQTPLGMRIR